jgi:hypothetical protein
MMEEWDGDLDVTAMAVGEVDFTRAAGRLDDWCASSGG